MTFDWTCLVVEYELSSDDVKLTADLLVDGVSNVNYMLLARDKMKIIVRNEGLGSSISLELTASRYLVTSADFEFAFVYSVNFQDLCGQHAEKGMAKNC